MVLREVFYQIWADLPQNGKLRCRHFTGDLPTQVRNGPQSRIEETIVRKL